MTIKRMLASITAFVVVFLFNQAFISVSTAKAPRLNGFEHFPASYRILLENLKKEHPSWTFTALITGIDWEHAIHMESKDSHTRSLISNTMPSAWKCKEKTCYNAETQSFISKEREDRMCASAVAVSYALDPRNYLYEELVFQFENISYDKDIHTIEGIEKIFEDSDFHYKNVTYKDKNGKEYDLKKTYSKLVMEAAQSSKVSPYHLASRIRQESLGSLSYKSVAGISEGFEGIYNFYNIGATAAADPTVNGLTFAKGDTDKSFLRPWSDPQKAITGGALWIGNGYINSGQNTLYLEKFDVDDSDGKLFWHQYMTFILTPVTEQSKVYNAYKDMGLLDYSLNFVIPVYKNMPDTPAPLPDNNYENYLTVDEKTMVYLYSNPAFSEILEQINSRNAPSLPEENIESTPKEEQDAKENIKSRPQKNDAGSKNSAKSMSGKKGRFIPFITCVLALVLLVFVKIFVCCKSKRSFFA